MTTLPAEPAVSSRIHAPVSRLRRLLASGIDGGLTLMLAALWWHWVQWAQYTETFSRQWPARIAIPAVTLIPVTVLWLEAISGRGLGKLLMRLRVVRFDCAEASLPRLLARSFLKWSPLLVGPAVLLLGAVGHSGFGDRFAGDRLVPLASALADILPAPAKTLAWTLEQSMRSLNVGAVILVLLGLDGFLASATAKRGLLDRISGTRVVRK